jgi:putative oxidoreductase
MTTMNGINDELLLVARVLLTALFVIFGLRKLLDFPGTIAQMVKLRVPLPKLAAAISTFMEVVVALVVALGAFTRPLAFLMALYTVGTAFLGHHYWTVKNPERVESMDGFFKDLAIVGGFLLLYMTGPGKYSIDALRSIATP